ncbi:hypothetical protein BU25DRAFT_145559 [Macroventuria anomochaeta]|uniref:Uncharacterized protein n=1 Tax=Macroventuria anomochaeta TaxID=301207 RepID=A0ACB6SDX3_9PLEO|nr:uncharacterized protein BU25DRAFT_145559 [Macroventuria anomochaeta]KAF2632239.1 hypothetical protein BU25DRAFT_145559 [Macroventuria anomochaeta]
MSLRLDHLPYTPCHSPVFVYPHSCRSSTLSAWLCGASSALAVWSVSAVSTTMAVKHDSVGGAGTGVYPPFSSMYRVRGCYLNPLQQFCLNFDRRLACWACRDFRSISMRYIGG